MIGAGLPKRIWVNLDAGAGVQADRLESGFDAFKNRLDFAALDLGEQRLFLEHLLDRDHRSRHVLKLSVGLGGVLLPG